MRTSEVRQGFNSRGKEKSMDVGSPARWFTDGLEKQAGTTVHAKVSSYRARLLLPRPGRRRCNKIGEKNNIHQRSNARKYYARSVKELSSSLSFSLPPYFVPFVDSPRRIVRLSPLRFTPSLLAFMHARINRPVLKLCCCTPRMKMIFERIFHAVDSWTCIFISIGPRAD